MKSISEMTNEEVVAQAQAIFADPGKARSFLYSLESIIEQTNYEVNRRQEMDLEPDPGEVLSDQIHTELCDSGGGIDDIFHELVRDSEDFNYGTEV